MARATDEISSFPDEEDVRNLLRSLLLGKFNLVTFLLKSELSLDLHLEGKPLICHIHEQRTSINPDVLREIIAFIKKHKVDSSFLNEEQRRELGI